MPETFGGRLRERREQRQVSISAIAEQTKISASLLEALERDDVSRWPSGIFRRAFIRSYANAIGLEPDALVREFLDLYPDPTEVAAAAAARDASAAAPSAIEGAPTRLRHLLGSTLGALTRSARATSEPEPAAAPDPNRASPVSSDEPAVQVPPPAPAPAREPDLAAAAELCTELGQVRDAVDATPLLEKACHLLTGSGAIVWAWQPDAGELKLALAHGYPRSLLDQLPAVRRDADNATAAAFRSARVCVVPGGTRASGALVIPVMAHGGCVGVFAIELQDGGEQHASVKALATIIAAQLSTIVAAARSTDGVVRKLA